MRLRLEVHVHHDDHRLDRIIQLEEQAMALIDDLTAQVTKNNDAIESAITLLGNLKAALDAAGTDPVKLQAIKDSLATEDDKLAAAIVANTPAAPPAPAPPPATP